MKYEDIKIGFLEKNIIKSKADEFRDKHWDRVLPVNIEGIIERMGIEIIPKSGLSASFDVDAFITSDWKTVYVDSDNYMKDSFQNRLRFSLVHEIGHLVLHKEIYPLFGIKTDQNFYDFFENIPENKYSMLEKQADMFANNFLIPRDLLKDALGEEKEKLSKAIKQEGANIELFDKAMIMGYISKPIGKRFGVCEDAANIALNSL